MRRFLFLGCAGFCIIAGWWQYSSSSDITAPVNTSGEGASTQSAAAFLVADTRSNAQVRSAVSRATFILSSGSKDMFDRFIFARQDASAQQVKNAFKQYSQPTFNEQTAGYAIAVFGRYVDYKVALSEEDMEVPGSGASIRDIADTLDAREILRRRFFNDREYDILFAAEAAEDDRALSRLRIAGDPGLTAKQKKQRIFEQLDALDEHQKLGFKPTVNMHKVAQIKQEFTDDTSRYNALAALLGDEPAQRMVATWQNQVRWQARVEQYRVYRQTLRSETVDIHTQNSMLNEYQRTHFSENERKRLNVVLAE